MNINDLERLWLSLCPEFECKGTVYAMWNG